MRMTTAPRAVVLNLPHSETIYIYIFLHVVVTLNDKIISLLLCNFIIAIVVKLDVISDMQDICYVYDLRSSCNQQVENSCPKASINCTSARQHHPAQTDS